MRAKAIASPMSKPCVEMHCPWCKAAARHFTYEREDADTYLETWLLWHIADRHPERMVATVDSATDLHVCA